MAMAAHILLRARQLALGSAAGVAALATYKSKTDPIHLFWDLDHTLLCSISPLPATLPASPVRDPGLPRPRPPGLGWFDQVDDDFPYDARTMAPNTRTFFRPGARWALALCSRFAVLHVYTAAQATYTANILDELDPDRRLFGTRVLHRDDYPQIVREGKDLMRGTDDVRRAVLFDDKPANFAPQGHDNGVACVPFTARRVSECHRWGAYWKEVVEMARLVGIALVASVHVSGDVRHVVRRVRRWDYVGRDERSTRLS